MTVSTNSSFDTYNALINKWPLYVIEFDGETNKYCNHIPESPSGTYKRYLHSIKGMQQTIKPEKGAATIGGVTISLLDCNEEITSMISSDTYNFHRKKVVIKAGYKGMTQANLITIATYWITGLKPSTDNLKWEFMATDPQKWLQQVLCRNATEESPITYSGNLVNILLEILTSSDSGTNSDYDLGDDDLGCDLDGDTVDITAIEDVRDKWFWGQSLWGEITLTDKVEAKELIEKEILQVLNCYPGITGVGKYKIIPFKPPMETTVTSIELTEDNMVGLPKLDLNFDGMINEIDFYFDYDYVDDEYDQNTYYIDSTSKTNRGNSTKPLKIETKALHTTHTTASIPMHGEQIIISRKDAIFQRYANPPVKLSAKVLFSEWIVEAGDIINFTHSKVKNAETGSSGITSELMEVVNRSVDWHNGVVKLNLLQTGFQKGIYSAASPSMTITSGSSGTSFSVSVADAARWSEGWEAMVQNPYGLEIATVTITDINYGTGAITCDDIGQTPGAGWMVVFADYDNCTADQKLWEFIADLSDYLGAANDAAHLIAA